MSIKDMSIDRFYFFLKLNFHPVFFLVELIPPLGGEALLAKIFTIATGRKREDDFLFKQKHDLSFKPETSE